ncbi:hypothetical protein Tcan_03379 [Toxocara canis]|nr:hypothetical protein Tcan_03379 [Toxocara canis]
MLVVALANASLDTNIIRQRRWSPMRPGMGGPGFSRPIDPGFGRPDPSRPIPPSYLKPTRPMPGMPLPGAGGPPFGIGGRFPPP